MVSRGWTHDSDLTPLPTLFFSIEMPICSQINNKIKGWIDFKQSKYPQEFLDVKVKWFPFVPFQKWVFPQRSATDESKPSVRSADRDADRNLVTSTLKSNDELTNTDSVLWGVIYEKTELKTRVKQMLTTSSDFIKQNSDKH